MSHAVQATFKTYTPVSKLCKTQNGNTKVVYCVSCGRNRDYRETVLVQIVEIKTLY